MEPGCSPRPCRGLWQREGSCLPWSCRPAAGLDSQGWSSCFQTPARLCAGRAPAASLRVLAQTKCKVWGTPGGVGCASPTGIGGLCSNPQGSLGSRSISEHLLCALSDILTSTKTRRGPAALSQGQSLGCKAAVPEGRGMCASTRPFPCPLHPFLCIWKKSPPNSSLPGGIHLSPTLPSIL